MQYEGVAGTARILVVDDEDSILEVLTELLANQFQVLTASDVSGAIECLDELGADVVLTDKNLPGPSGLLLLAHVKKHFEDTEVVMMTGYASLESAIEAMRLGAYDYLLKPFDDVALVSDKIRRAVEKGELSKDRRKLMEQVLVANAELRLAHEQLRKAYLETVAGMIKALEARDAYTRGHSERVASYAVLIASAMGIQGKDLDEIREGAILHDLGKIGVREDVLNKKGRLTDEEFAHIKTHPLIGAEIVGMIEAYRHLLPMVRHHHERIDGRGYPDGLRGDEIQLSARIIAVADCFDAMTSKRPYRDPMPIEKAKKEIQDSAGTQLDARVVGAFLMASMQPGFMEIMD
ncbi:MAG: response regulator [Deltaproteobacteria bacterium]|nr:response regulator [Deltaproteobacteria bacterium]